jgi:hypothetical protein
VPIRFSFAILTALVIVKDAVVAQAETLLWLERLRFDERRKDTARSKGRTPALGGLKVGGSANKNFPSVVTTPVMDPSE